MLRPNSSTNGSVTGCHLVLRRAASKAQARWVMLWMARALLSDALCTVDLALL